MIPYTNFIYHLGEFGGSDMLEFQSCDMPERGKFKDPHSLYVEDVAFYWYLEGLFQNVVSGFDMFEDTRISREQWDKIMQLDLPEHLDADAYELDLVAKTLAGIDRWVTENVSKGGSFLVIGV